MKVGVVGLGVIGTAQVDMFGPHVHVTYDPAVHDIYPYELLAECDFAVVCVGTPPKPDGHADLSQVGDAIGRLPENLPVALRSTVPPGTTDWLLAPRLYAHVPEFMGENVLHSWQRSEQVPYMIVGGGTPEAGLFFEQAFSRVFPGQIHTCAAVEAELAKYAANLYWATRVTFVNEFANICETFGVDYERVRDAWLTDPRMSEPYTRTCRLPARVRRSLLAEGPDGADRRVHRRRLPPRVPVGGRRRERQVPGGRMISVLLATTGRPDMVETFVASLIETTGGYDIELVVAVDADSETIDRLAEIDRPKRFRVVVDWRDRLRGPSKAWNDALGDVAAATRSCSPATTSSSSPAGSKRRSRPYTASRTTGVWSGSTTATGTAASCRPTT